MLNFISSHSGESPIRRWRLKFDNGQNNLELLVKGTVPYCREEYVDATYYGIKQKVVSHREWQPAIFHLVHTIYPNKKEDLMKQLMWFMEPGRGPSFGFTLEMVDNWGGTISKIALSALVSEIEFRKNDNMTITLVPVDMQVYF